MSLPTCERCGVQLSSPTGRCQACGHPLTLALQPGCTLVEPESPQAEASTREFEDRRAATRPAAEEDEGKVDVLLRHIAGQSHFEERYELKGLLASGGMGEVHRAWDHILRREVAVKMMSGERDESKTAALRGQFLKEARVGGRLLHPNILAVFDLGVNRSGQIYFTMRLVDGASLQHCLDALAKGVLTRLVAYPLRRVIETFTSACQGVEHAHRDRVLHLDLKPHNILVSGFNEVFVIDWGLAKIDDVDDVETLIDLYRDRGNHHITASMTGAFGGHVLGTPAYMVPEQAIGATEQYNETTDVYGLGGVLYFLLYGEVPNGGTTLPQILAASSQPKVKGKLREGILPRGRRVKKETLEAVEALEPICLKALACASEGSLSERRGTDRRAERVAGPHAGLAPRFLTGHLTPASYTDSSDRPVPSPAVSAPAAESCPP